MNKVYVIECASGSHDSFHWWIGGIFTDPNTAENEAKKMNDRAMEIRDLNPIKLNDDEDCYDLNDDDYETYWAYHCKYENEMEWREATVIEMELNKIHIP